MWQKSLQEFSNELKRPQVVEERCVLALVERATCRACVDVCPRGAWQLDDERLGLDIEACDGCGLCAAACPEGALTHDYRPLVIRMAEGPLAVVACEQAVGNEEVSEGRVPCIHALTLGAILALYSDGVHGFLLAVGDCQRCSRGGDLSVFHLLDRLNGLLHQRDLPRIRYRAMEREQWLGALQQACRREQGPRLNRRGFLRGAVSHSFEQGLRMKGGFFDTGKFLPPGNYLPSGPGQLVPFDPRFDPQRCNGCGLCARICPHEAIVLPSPRQGGESALRANADNCTGCKLCVDLCELGAVRIEPWAVSQDAPVALLGHRCRACGNDYYLPRGTAEGEGLCSVCARTRHRGALYQVLG
jgi:ferredoxin